jgi:hypothetical protein
MTHTDFYNKWRSRVLRFLLHYDLFNRFFCWTQRQLYGYCFWEVHSINFHLVERLLPMLKERVAKVDGYPCIEDFHHLDTDVAFNQWKNILQEIHDGLAFWLKVYSDDEQETMFGKSWEARLLIYDEANQKAQRALELFARYFNYL